MPEFRKHGETALCLECFTTRRKAEHGSIGKSCDRSPASLSATKQPATRAESLAHDKYDKNKKTGDELAAAAEKLTISLSKGPGCRF